MEVKGITAGANMWALLRDDDPGESDTFVAAKKIKPVAAVEVEEPPAISGKSAKRAAKAKKDRKNSKNKKLGAADKQAAEAEEEADVGEVQKADVGEMQKHNADAGEVQKTDGRRKDKRRGRKGKEAPPLSAVASGHCRAVAERICKAVVAATLLVLSYRALVSAAHPVAGGSAI